MSERHDTNPGIPPVGAHPPAGPPSEPQPVTQQFPAAGGQGYGDPGYGDRGYGDRGYGDKGYEDKGYGETAYPGYGAPNEGYYTSPEYTTQPVARRRPDVVAGLLLLLAGGAAGVSLVLHWLNGETVNGLDLVRRAFTEVGKGVGNVYDSGLWQPLLIIFGGGVLAVLGLLMFVPARSHRTLGVIALVVTLFIVASVLVPLGRAAWKFDKFDVGFWFAMAVAVLGLLGSLKALVTGRKYETAPSAL